MYGRGHFSWAYLGTLGQICGAMPGARAPYCAYYPHCKHHLRSRVPCSRRFRFFKIERDTREAREEAARAACWWLAQTMDFEWPDAHGKHLHCCMEIVLPLKYIESRKILAPPAHRIVADDGAPGLKPVLKTSGATPAKAKSSKASVPDAAPKGAAKAFAAAKELASPLVAAAAPGLAPTPKASSPKRSQTTKLNLNYPGLCRHRHRPSKVAAN